MNKISASGTSEVYADAEGELGMERLLVIPRISSEIHSDAEIQIALPPEVETISHRRREIQSVMPEDHTSDPHVAIQRETPESPFGACVEKDGELTTIVIFRQPVALIHHSRTHEEMRIDLIAVRGGEPVIDRRPTIAPAIAAERQIGIRIDKSPVTLPEIPAPRHRHENHRHQYNQYPDPLFHIIPEKTMFKIEFMHFTEFELQP